MNVGMWVECPLGACPGQRLGVHMFDWQREVFEKSNNSSEFIWCWGQSSFCVYVITAIYPVFSYFLTITSGEGFSRLNTAIPTCV